MASDDYLYDVAFSFLGQDEAQARKLNDLVARRMKTFIYSDAERQVHLGGADGGAAFSQVFTRDARTVVILYRSGWGDKGFTAVESTAIRNRAFDLGHEFVTLIPLDSPPTTPLWFPKHRLWVGLEHWGWEHVAAVVEARAIEVGSQPHEETIADVAASTKRAIDSSSSRKTFLNSQAGADAALEEFARLVRLLQEGAHESLGMVKPETGSGYCALMCGQLAATAAFDLKWTNTAEQSGLRVIENARGHEQRRTEYEFDRVDDALGWKIQGSRPLKVLTSGELATAIVKALLRKRAAQVREE